MYGTKCPTGDEESQVSGLRSRVVLFLDCLFLISVVLIRSQPGSSTKHGIFTGCVESRLSKMAGWREVVEPSQVAMVDA